MRRWSQASSNSLYRDSCHRLQNQKKELTLMIRSPVWTPARIAAPSRTQRAESEDWRFVHQMSPFVRWLSRFWLRQASRQRPSRLQPDGTKRGGVHVSEPLLTFFNQLYKHRVVSAHRQPEAVLISLDYHAPRDQTWAPTKKMVKLHRPIFLVFVLFRKWQVQNLWFLFLQITRRNFK